MTNLYLVFNIYYQFRITSRYDYVFLQIQLNFRYYEKRQKDKNRTKMIIKQDMIRP